MFGKIFRNHLPTLYISEKVKKVVPNPPLVANRWPKNLKDRLVRATKKPPQQLHEGNSPCGRPRCKSCVHIWTGMTFAATITGEKFRTRVTANCRTKNIVYLTECQRCKKQYVGETDNPLHLRMNGHRSDYFRKLSDKPVVEHFNTIGPSFEDLTVMAIEQIMADSDRRKQRESFWIHTLWPLAPDGFNLDPWGSLVEIKPGFTGGFLGEKSHACTTTVEKGKYKTIPSLHCVRLIKNTATLYKECFKTTSRGNIETTSRKSRGQRTRATEKGFTGRNAHIASSRK